MHRHSRKKKIKIIAMNNKKKILIVDDSKIMRKGLSKIFEASEDFEVVGEAADGKEALDAIKHMQPDVVTLDVVMPGMDGLTTLKHIMIECPRPTVMLSSLTQDGSKTTFDALRYGAVDFISKPSRLEADYVSDLSEDIINKLNSAVSMDVEIASYIRTSIKKSGTENQSEGKCEELIAIGAAEGGYRALMNVVPYLDSKHAAYLVVLYAHEDHLDEFIQYLDEHSNVHVKRACDGDMIETGICYVSTGSDYMSVHDSDDGMNLHISPAPFSNRRGSVDRLFFSIADILAEKTMGIVLSGAEQDGAEGLEEILRVGGAAIAQDPKTCLNREMPMAVLASGKLNFDMILPDSEMATVINSLTA